MKHLLTVVVSLFALSLAQGDPSTVPGDYQGTPFQDSVYKAGAQSIPGILQCALYDLGGEGVAYHDTDAINHGSGELNVQPNHQRPHAGPYIWSFRKDEGMDLSYVKDFADLNHPNAVSPLVNQFYIGWTADGEWCNYTVDVKAVGTYKIRALYSNQANAITFDINGKPSATCKLPIATGGFHTWNYAEIGTITFGQAGRQLLTFHDNTGNNFAFFEFEKVEPKEQKRE
ncbi:MAG: carbohydrate-binding protein [Phycisphaerae bacterium]|nr:carbohydrate-binding protein [Phycisphaerae bacterium]